VRLGNIIAGLILAACIYLIYQKVVPRMIVDAVIRDIFRPAPATGSPASSAPTYASPASTATANTSTSSSLVATLTSLFHGNSPATTASATVNADSPRARAERQRQFVNEPRYYFQGTVERHLKGGALLVLGHIYQKTAANRGDSVYFALLDPPDPNLGDNHFLQGLACATAPVAGPSGNVDAYLYTDHEAFDLLPKFDHFGRAINRDPNGPFVTAPESGHQNMLEQPAHPVMPGR
jgi:hypothetical protein